VHLTVLGVATDAECSACDDNVPEKFWACAVAGIDEENSGSVAYAIIPGIIGTTIFKIIDSRDYMRT
jgi:hypothetical protein